MPLYKLTSPSGKAYIGITRGPLNSRLNHHHFDARNGSPGLLHKAIRKYGFDNFTSEVLNESCDPNELCVLEVAAIADHSTFKPRGYNLTLGGEGVTGTKLTEERVTALVAARSKRRAEKTEVELSVENENRRRGVMNSARSLSKGVAHSDKLSAARAARTPEQVEEEKAKRSAAAKARWAKVGHREKVRAAQAETFAGDNFKANRSIASKLAWEKQRETRANRTPDQIEREKSNRAAATKARWAAGNFRKTTAC